MASKKLPWEDVKVGAVVFREGAYRAVLVSRPGTAEDKGPHWVVNLSLPLEGIKLLSLCGGDVIFWNAETGEGKPFDQWSVD